MSSTLTSNIDLAEILFTLFWVFFIGLIVYLRREDKREGYPLASDRGGSATIQGFPAVPTAKTFRLAHGGERRAPNNDRDDRAIAAKPAAPHPGAPLMPTGNPMLAGVGPASYAQRSDTPDLTLDGQNRVVPMRVAHDFSVSSRDADPRGMSVVGADGVAVGTVSDVWVDRSEPQIFFLEINLDEANGGRAALLPFAFADVNKGKRSIRVDALYSHQFRDVPALQSPDQVTLLEEDKICAYYAGGLLYADAQRQEPLL